MEAHPTEVEAHLTATHPGILWDLVTAAHPADTYLQALTHLPDQMKPEPARPIHPREQAHPVTADPLAALRSAAAEDV